MPRPATTNANVAALRRNLAADAFGQSVRNLQGGGAATGVSTNTAVQRRNMLTSAVIVAITACAFTIGESRVFDRMGDASAVCDSTAAQLRLYSILFVSRLWLSTLLSFALFAFWNPRVELTAQSSLIKVISQVRCACTIVHPPYLLISF